jgi:hypothetical protein
VGTGISEQHIELLGIALLGVAALLQILRRDVAPPTHAV